eukprot:UN05927
MRHLFYITILGYLISFNLMTEKTHHDFQTPHILNRVTGHYHNASSDASQYDYCRTKPEDLADSTIWPCKEVGSYNIFTPTLSTQFQIRTGTLTERVWRLKDGSVFRPLYLMNWYYTLGAENRTTIGLQHT